MSNTNTQSIDALGFVTVDQIQNVFTESMDMIEEDLMRQGVPTDHRTIIEWIDHLRQDLMKRARTNVSDYVRKNPMVKVSEREQKAALEAQATRKKSWDERIKESRAEHKSQARADAIRDCY